MERQGFARLALAAALSVLVLGATASTALGATITVGCGNVPGLIAALQNAGNGDTVNLGKKCTYTLTAPFSGSDGLPKVTVSLRINGRGSTIARSSAAGTALFRILHVDTGGNLRLQDTTLTNGALDNFPGQNGGGILNSGGTLTMTGVTVTANKAFQGGGVNSYGGTFTMKKSVVSNNEGTDHGGGMHLFGNATITDSQVTNNTAWILAGGILGGGPTTLVRTVVSGNTASAGGGIISYSGSNSPLMLINSQVTNNTALGYGGIDTYGGVVWIVASTISGNTATQGPGGGINSSGTLAVFSSTIANNSASTDGGGIYSTGTTLLSYASVTGNSALFGGGGSVSGSVTVYRSTFSGNTATYGGGGAILAGSGTVSLVDSTFSGNSAQFGGAIKAYGTLTVDRSTFTGNSATLGGGLALLFSPASATIVNSTFWGNTAGTGGGVLTYSDVHVFSSTFGANSAWLTGAAGGIQVVISTVPIGIIEVRNSIVATNTGTNPNVGGPVTSFGHNVIGDSTGSSGWAASDATGVNSPGLAAGLASNGGLTPTVALLAGSPAIDFVPTGSCLDATGSALTDDQRLSVRPAGSACDAGAYEY